MSSEKPLFSLNTKSTILPTKFGGHRSVAANLVEAHRKRRYKNAFVLKVSDADAEAMEVQVWLDFAKDFGYLSLTKHQELTAGYEELGRMLGGILNAPEKFLVH